MYFRVRRSVFPTLGAVRAKYERMNSAMGAPSTPLVPLHAASATPLASVPMPFATHDSCVVLSAVIEARVRVRVGLKCSLVYTSLEIVLSRTGLDSYSGF